MSCITFISCTLLYITCFIICERKVTSLSLIFGSLLLLPKLVILYLLQNIGGLTYYQLYSHTLPITEYNASVRQRIPSKEGYPPSRGNSSLFQC